MKMTPPPATKPIASRKSLLFPMVFSALVAGSGQFLQRRWMAGIFFLVASTAASGWLMRSVFVVLKSYYSMAADPMKPREDVPGWMELIIPFLLWLTVYVAGLIDTAMANYRHQVKTSRSHQG